MINRKKKNVLVFLSMQPEEGGKYQYSLSFLDGLQLISKEDFKIIAVYKDENWKEYLDEQGIESYQFIEKRRRLVPKLKSLLTKRMNFVGLWRILAKFIDSDYKFFKSFSPFIICYPGSDRFAYELPFRSIFPVFDIMHKYENFPEFSSQQILNARDHLYKFSCKYAFRILVDSALGKKQLLESYKVSEEKVIIMPYVAPDYMYRHDHLEKNPYTTFPSKYIFYPAQFWTHKNHSVIIKALQILRDEYNFILDAVFVGSEKNNLDNIKKNIEEFNLNGKVKILGYVSNMELVALYKSALALVYPSLLGPTNIPPLEALAVGCPVIIADVYANKEQLGDKAVYFDPKNPQQLAVKIHELINNSQKLKNKLVPLPKEIFGIKNLDIFTGNGSN